MLNINLGERCRKTGGAKTLKCDEKLVRLEETYGDWVKQEKENCRLSSGAMTKELYPYRALFSPIQVNRTMIKNRVVMGPMGNLNMCEESGRPNDKMLQYFFARAKGGTGLLTTGLIPVSHGIDPTWKSRTTDLCDDKTSDSGVRIHKSKLLYSTAPMHSADGCKFEKNCKKLWAGGSRCQRDGVRRYLSAWA